MAKLKELLPSRRRLIQLYTALLYNAHIKGFIKGEIYTGQLKNVCVPGLNCYSCPGAVGACPLGALQNALASSDKRAPFYILGILMLLGLIFGRTICGFLCPLGLLQELLHKIPVPKLRKSRFTRWLSLLKYAILMVFVIAIPLKYAAISLPVPGFCKYICPAGTLEGALGLLSNPANEDKLSLLNLLFTRKFIILVLIVVGCLFIHRCFCRFLCPLGAIYGCFNRVALLGVTVDCSKCTSCGLCVAKCEMDVRRVGDRECIGCGKCIAVCPVKAIGRKTGKLCVKRKWPRICAVIAALLLLAGVLWSANQPEPEAAYTAEVGFNVGERCPSFTVQLYGAEGGEFALSSCTGKVAVINFWATWCTPCCAELPCFQQLADTYPEIEVVAIHSSLVTDDVQSYIDKQSYTLPFALDADGSVLAALGGANMLPVTVVVDKNGVIAYNSVGSVTYEKLENIVLPLLAVQ